MKTSWIIGLVMFYLVIFACEMIVTGGSSLGATTSSNITNIATSNQTALIAPNFQQSTNVFTGAWAVVSDTASFLVLLLQILALWCPTVFSGNMLWFWWFICFPVDCGMVASIIFIARGVHSA